MSTEIEDLLSEIKELTTQSVMITKRVRVLRVRLQTICPHSKMEHMREWDGHKMGIYNVCMVCDYWTKI